MKKRIVALLLCCVMLLTLSPNLIATAVADDETVPTVEEQVKEPVEEKVEESKVEESKAEEKVEDETTDETKDKVPATPEQPVDPEQPAAEPEEPVAKPETKTETETKTEEPVESEIVNPTVNYTDVAPFLPPVSGSTMLRAARAAANDATGDAGEKDSGMKVSKTATDNGDGTYTITLEAYATGAQVITEIKEDVPTDIILVLDQSGSMARCITCGQEISRWSNTHNTYVAVNTVNTSNTTYYVKNGSSYTPVSYCDGRHFGGSCSGGAGWYTSERRSDHTAGNKITPKTSENPNGTQFYSSTSEACVSRLNALKTAVTNFVNAVNEKAKGKDEQYGGGDDVAHRVAVVTFTDSAKDLTGGLVEMDKASGLQTVKSAVNKLSAGGDTYPAEGLELANSIFARNPVPEGEAKNRVIVLFTDGYPAEYGTDNINYTLCDNAVSTAKVSKDTYGATVYTIGIFSGANPGSDIDTNFEYGNRRDSAKQLVAANRYMHYTSCNFKDAQSMQNGGAKSGDGYYLSAGDAASLNSIFQQISSNITTGGSSTTLDEKTVIKDIISPQFTVPENAETIMVYTAESDGNTTAWKNRVPYEANVTIDQTMRTISVTNFSFKDNWCGNQTQNGTTTFHNGKKLIIEFTVSLREGFLGGNNVFTNAAAGVYPNADAMEPVVSFPQPTVDVPIQPVTVTAQDKNVYLLGSVTADDLKSGATVKVGDVELNLGKDNYGLETWQTEYVTIDVKVMDKDGNEVSSAGLTNLTDDTTYTIAVTVKPKTGTATVKDGTDEAKINVFKPELTFQDSVAYYGDKAPDFGGKTEWKHPEATGDILGEKPELNITYTTETGKIVDGKINTKQDVPVAVSVNIGKTDVDSYTTFVHQACTPACGWTDPETPNGNPAFLLHVQTCSLTITKTGGAANEPYVFNVYKDGKKYTEVTITGNDSVTIYELPVGNYTIQEDTGWSWRYSSPKYSTNGAALSAEKSTGTITCTNTREDNKWLNGFSAVVTNIFGAKH